MYSLISLWPSKLIKDRCKLQSALVSVTPDLLPTSAVELRTFFRRRLVKFRQLQMQYQPEVTPLLAQFPATDADIDTVQDVSLYLPSSLPPDILSRCSTRLVSMETELRIGQCRDSLTQLRIKLTAKARLLKYKYVHVRHQAPNTRSRNSLSRINAKIEVLAAKYRYAFSTLNVLDPLGQSGWRSEFLQLSNQDIRGLSQAELPNAPSQARAEELQARSLLSGNVMPEGSRKVSWIWRGSLGNSGNLDIQDEFNEGSVLYSLHTIY